MLFEQENSTSTIYVFRSIQYYVTVDMELGRDSEVGFQLNPGYFRTRPRMASDITDVDLSLIQRDVEEQLDNYNQRGSGWNLIKLSKFVIHYVKYHPFVGASFIPTPDYLKRKHAVINVQNEDNECFKWAILSCLFPAHHSDRVSQLYPSCRQGGFFIFAFSSHYSSNSPV